MQAGAALAASRIAFNCSSVIWASVNFLTDCLAAIGFIKIPFYIFLSISNLWYVLYTKYMIHAV